MITTEPNNWTKAFDERQRRLIVNCRDYAASDPAGVPGHNLMLIIAQMAELLDMTDGIVPRYKVAVDPTWKKGEGGG